MRANAPIGAYIMTYPVILYMISAKDATKSATNLPLSPAALMQKPKKTENNISGSRSPAAMDATTLLGTMFRMVCRKPGNSFPSYTAASPPASWTPTPGCITFATTMPSIIARHIVATYSMIAFTATRPSFFILFMELVPDMMDAINKGTTNILTRLINISPRGLIGAVSIPIELQAAPIIIPKIKAMIIEF